MSMKREESRAPLMKGDGGGTLGSLEMKMWSFFNLVLTLDS